MENQKLTIASGTGKFTIFRAPPDIHQSPIIIEQTSTGSHVFHTSIERGEVCFHYSSPGLGGQVAKIPFSQLDATYPKQFLFNWHPEIPISLVALSPQGRDQDIITNGAPTKRIYRVGKDRNIHQVGDEGVTLLEMRISIDGEEVIAPTAIENWNATIEANSILKKGSSKDGHIFEVIVRNQALNQLVTGFETYCKTRFVELEQEGLTPDTDQLVRTICRSSEDTDSLLQSSKRNAQENSMGLLEYWILKDRRGNFQDFDQAKKLFNKTYDIRFGEIGVDGNEIANIKKLIGHRHDVIHLSPLAMLTPDNNPSRGKELLDSSSDLFDHFITSLHSATLSELAK